MFAARAAKGKDDKLDKLTPKERVSSTSDCAVDVASAFEISQCYIFFTHTNSKI